MAIGPRARWNIIGCVVMVMVVIGACSTDSGNGASDPGGSGGEAGTTAARPKNSTDLHQRVQTLGQDQLVVSQQSPQDRLANGLTPLTGTPLFVGDYADPFVLAIGPVLYLYTTNTVDENVPVLNSVAGVVASPAGDALPELPEWTEPGLVWAPAVLSTEEGFVLYYTSKDSESGLQCVGAAFSTSPLGPFVDDNDEAFVCQRDLGGTIDASPFVSEDGTAWLLFKNDGNCCDITTELWIQQLSGDGLALEGAPTSLLSTSEGWEGPSSKVPR